MICTIWPFESEVRWIWERQCEFGENTIWRQTVKNNLCFNLFVQIHSVTLSILLTNDSNLLNEQSSFQSQSDILSDNPQPSSAHNHRENTKVNNYFRDKTYGNDCGSQSEHGSGSAGLLGIEAPRHGCYKVNLCWSNGSREHRRCHNYCPQAWRSAEWQLEGVSDHFLWQLGYLFVHSNGIWLNDG